MKTFENPPLVGVFAVVVAGVVLVLALVGGLSGPSLPVTGGEVGQASMVEEATALIPKLESMFGYEGPTKAGWAELYALLGRKDDARRVLKEAESVRDEYYISPTDIALVHIQLGEIDAAFAWLDTAYEEKSSGLVSIKVEPGYDPIRSDPRFAALLRKMGLDG